jgi:hypothetical protein
MMRGDRFVGLFHTPTSFPLTIFERTLAKFGVVIVVRIVIITEIAAATT